MVDGLSAGRMYRVQVAAYTRIGTGPTNKVIYVVLPEGKFLTNTFLNVFPLHVAIVYLPLTRQ